jgi:type IV fimbrial biogenesis protein FimT
MGDDVEQLLADEERRFVLTPRRRGFTLIELAIVLVIFGILMQLAIPSFRSWLANGRVRTVAESLQNDLRQAQAEAVRRNRQVALVLTDSSPTIANPESTASTSARNWVAYALPLLGGGEDANGITSATNDVGTTGFIRGYSQDAGSDTRVTGDVAALCFNSVGRLVTSSSAIANAGGVTCTLTTSNEPRYFRVQNAAADRPMWVAVALGGQIRLCDPNRTLPDQPGGCCSERCCGQSDADYCVY